MESVLFFVMKFSVVWVLQLEIGIFYIQLFFRTKECKELIMNPKSGNSNRVTTPSRVESENDGDDIDDNESAMSEDDEDNENEEGGDEQANESSDEDQEMEEEDSSGEYFKEYMLKINILS